MIHSYGPLNDSRTRPYLHKHIRKPAHTRTTAYTSRVRYSSCRSQRPDIHETDFRPLPRLPENRQPCPETPAHQDQEIIAITAPAIHAHEKPHLRSSNMNYFSPTIGVRFNSSTNVRHEILDIRRTSTPMPLNEYRARPFRRRPVTPLQTSHTVANRQRIFADGYHRG